MCACSRSNMTKAVVFDLGGTLMEYKGMPLNWEGFYYQGFQNVNRRNHLNLSEEDVLEAHTFEYAEETIGQCRRNGVHVACLTDLPNGMPDRIFRSAVISIEPLLDLYVSSQICGARKPSGKGIEYIAAYFGIEVPEVLLVGDEKKDEETAVNAGCGFMYIGEFLNRYGLIK